MTVALSGPTTLDLFSTQTGPLKDVTEIQAPASISRGSQEVASKEMRARERIMIFIIVHVKEK